MNESRENTCELSEWVRSYPVGVIMQGLIPSSTVLEIHM